MFPGCFIFGANLYGRSCLNLQGGSTLPFNNLAKSGDQAINFLNGVVVHEADAEEASGFFHVEVLGDVDCIIVAVPGEKSALAKLGREFQWRMSGFTIIDADCEGGTALVEACWIGDAIDLQSWNLFQT